ncbi:MAG TPA: hypothetical protein VJ731_07750 [Terriglobales bacterium]|nr:hypothetical protein [Terriglobales bacterium]
MSVTCACWIEPGTLADWLVAIGTIALAAIAIAQDTIRRLIYHPRFKVSCKTEPPDCVAVPMARPDGTFLADSIYLRIFIQNEGNATAQDVEVYAMQLRRQRADQSWETVDSFPPMNLIWSNFGGAMYARIVPGMGKHCDVGHIVDPARRQVVAEDSPRLGLASSQTSLAFDLVARPNNRTHIVGPGNYELDIQIAAENVPPAKRTLTLSVVGPWYADEMRMLREGVGISVTR